MRARQLSFLPKLPSHHGGTLTQGRRKTARPIDPKSPLHTVLRASKARGRWSMLHPDHVDRIDAKVRSLAAKHGIKLYRLANVGNHLHLLIQPKSRGIQARRAVANFLREMSGAVAMLVTGARKGNAKGPFWDLLTYSRIVSWGRDMSSVHLYFVKNFFEAAGLFGPRDKAAGLRVMRAGEEAG